MKNKELLIRTLILAVVWLAIGWELIAFLSSSQHSLAEAPKQILASALLLCIVYVLSGQRQDDDDWAGQY